MKDHAQAIGFHETIEQASKSGQIHFVARPGCGRHKQLAAHIPRAHLLLHIARVLIVRPPFQSAWWLPGAHAATLWGKFGRQEPELSVRWETVEMADGDFVELAHYDASPHHAASYSDQNTPRLFILHGLEGGVNSNYVRGLMREANARGWHATLMLFRTCGPTPNRLKRSYHSGETTDPLAVIQKLANEQPLAPIGAVGVSLGGNVLCKLLGQLGDAVPVQLQAAAAISAPFDLARASRYIGRGFGRVYENAFLRSLVPKAVQKIDRHPELSSLQSIQHARTIWDFDDAFTSPVHGFANAADYYAQSSSLQFLSGIRRPTLLLSAVDDPFLPPEVLDEVRATTASNSAITIEFPANGGHVGFVGGRAPWRPSYYAEGRAVAFIAQQLREVHTNSIPGQCTDPPIDISQSQIQDHANTESHPPANGAETPTHDHHEAH